MTDPNPHRTSRPAAGPHGLAALHDPRSVAVIGASDDPDKIGGRPIHFMTQHGFTGRIVPVNPRRDSVQGLATVSTVRDADIVPDVALIAVPGQAAVDAVTDCADLGVPAAVVMASGFGEGDHQPGHGQLSTMLAAARDAGMRLVGPNSQGLANFATGAILTFSTLIREIPPLDGPVAIVSQSGAMASVPYAMLREAGIGVRYAHATGNDADVSAGELAALCVADPEVRLLILYLEDMARPADLAAAAAAAHARDVPILAVVGGRSAAGQRAASSHTGALANERRVVDAALAKLGIWSARSMAEVVDMAPLYLRGWRPTGRRLAVISSSGAICVLAADAAAEHELPLAELAPTTVERLQQTLPPFAATSNPVDLTAALLTDGSLVGSTLEAVAADPGVDAVFLGIPVAGRGYDVDRFAKDAGALSAASPVPFVTSLPQSAVREVFTRHDVVTFDDEARALAALGSYLRHHELRSSADPGRWTPRPRRSRDESARLLDEPTSLARLAAGGVPVVDHRVVPLSGHCYQPAALHQAVAALTDAGASGVVIKGVTAQVSHKSDLGLVELGARTGAEAQAAADRILASATRHRLELSGLLVAALRPGLHELLLGAHHDPVFGPVVLVGAGGRYVEALPDVAVLLPPVTETEVHAALDRLRIRPVLDGVRGEPAADLDAVAAAVRAVADLIGDPDGTVQSVDVNPLMLLPDGCVAADAVVLDQR